MCLLVLPIQPQADDAVLFHEEFDTLALWEPLFFPKIEKHTEYRLEQTEGEQSVLVAEADESASGIVCQIAYDVRQYPKLRWRWKVSNVYARGDARRKEGDDYPLRIYVMFEYDPGEAPFSMRVKYALAKALYGTYPPHSALNYIWANRPHEDDVIPNAYTERTMMIPLRSGSSQTGLWMEEEVDVRADYRRAFGEDPPARARLAVMSDADNTGESAVGFLDYVEVSSR